MVGTASKLQHHIPLTAEGELALQIRGSSRAGQIVRLKSHKCSIGSDKHCTLRVRTRSVKPLHCVIFRGQAATFVRSWAPDTRLNGQSFSDAPLSPGDRIGIGPIEFEVLDPTDERIHRDEVSDSRESTPATKPGSAGGTATAGQEDLDRLTSRLVLANQQGRSRVRGLIEQLRLARTDFLRLQLASASAEDGSAPAADDSQQQLIATELAQQQQALEEEHRQLEITGREAEQQLQERAEELDEQARRLDVRAKALDEEAAALDEQAAALDEQAKALDEQAKGFDELTSQLEEKTRGLDARAAALDEQAKEFDEQVRAFDGQMGQLEAEKSALEQERSEWESSRAETEEQLAVRAAEIDKHEVELESHLVELPDASVVGEVMPTDLEPADTILQEAAASANEQTEDVSPEVDIADLEPPQDVVPDRSGASSPGAEMSVDDLAHDESVAEYMTRLLGRVQRLDGDRDGSPQAETEPQSTVDFSAPVSELPSREEPLEVEPDFELTPAERSDPHDSTWQPPEPELEQAPALATVQDSAIDSAKEAIDGPRPEVRKRKTASRVLVASLGILSGIIAAWGWETGFLPFYVILAEIACFGGVALVGVWYLRRVGKSQPE